MKRLLALDVMRGLTIALMITVNMPGSWKYVYAPLRHASWHGCTPTDLVFPFFLFIMGTAMWYSFKKYTISSDRTKKIVKRVFLIFSIGLFLNAFPFFNFSKLRIMGVLQRIALVYGAAAFLVLYLKPRYLYFTASALLLGYWGVLYFGGTYEPESNLALKIDTSILGKSHIWKGLGFPFDPEGLLSTFPSIVTVLLGYIAGKLVDTATSTLQAIKKLFVIGATLAAIGWVWGIIFPINKSLWTSSYVLFTGGLAMLFLALLLWVIDVKGYKKWIYPFIHFGTNPLLIYVLSGLYTRTLWYLIKINEGEQQINGYAFLYKKIFVPIAGNMQGSLLFALSHIFIFWVIVYVLYRKKIFVKI